MAHWRDAVREAPGGVLLFVEVAAGARQAAFPDGFNPWREGRIGVRVKAPAEAGLANAEVVQAVAAFFGVPGANLTVESGATQSRKTLAIAGLPRAAAVARLVVALGAQ